MVKQYEPLYTVKEASKILKMNTNSIRNLIKAGKLPCLILGSMKI